MQTGSLLFLIILIILFLRWRKRRLSYVPHCSSCEAGIVDTILVIREMDDSNVIIRHDSLIYPGAMVTSRECLKKSYIF